MGPNSYMLCYGNLSYEPIAFDSNDLHWKNKAIMGFAMVPWILSLKEEERKNVYK